MKFVENGNMTQFEVTMKKCIESVSVIVNALIRINRELCCSWKEWEVPLLGGRKQPLMIRGKI